MNGIEKSKERKLLRYGSGEYFWEEAAHRGSRLDAYLRADTRVALFNYDPPRQAAAHSARARDAGHALHARQRCAVSAHNGRRVRIEERAGNGASAAWWNEM